MASVSSIESSSAGPGAWGRAVAAFERICGTVLSDRAARRVLGLTILLAALAPLGPLAANRFHHDEAVYSSWGLDIASGRDLMVSGSPVDKPPLFLYVQALSFRLFGPTETAARLPSLVTSVVNVILLYQLGRRLYGQGVGLLAAFLLAASPFAILFAPTAFTDPMMITFVLAGCLMAAQGHWGWAGLLLGLAAMTKQQGILFVPLAVGMAHVSRLGRSRVVSPTETAAGGDSATPRGISGVTRFWIGLLVVLALTVMWDVARGRYPGFLVQGLLSYGDLSLGSMVIWERLAGFVSLLRYSSGSTLLNGILLIGLAILLVVDVVILGASARGGKTQLESNLPQPGSDRHVPSLMGARVDLLVIGFVVFFLLCHSIIPFRVWDRYMLGIVPFLCLLLGRVLTLPWRWLHHRRSGLTAGDVGNTGATEMSPGLRPPSTGATYSVYNVLDSRLVTSISRCLYLLLLTAVLSTTAGPVRDAAASRLPIGGDHGAYQGIEQVVDYFRTVPGDTTLYHRWLGGHWRFYLWGSPYDFRAWTSPADLAAQAAALPGASRYVVFPSWRSSTEARLALGRSGLSLREVHRALRSDGTVSFIVYRIEEAR